jgi:hypothetical protein
VQLNVSYNFKRLALKNDFYIRQYMIENGMNLTKEDEGDNSMETALEIHQIHNVIRTSNRRSLIAPPPHISVSELRRNSTTSSVSGVSAMIMNGCDNNGSVANNGTNGESGNFVHPSRPFNVRPIQIKIEPIDPDYEDATNGQSTTVQSSPSNSSGSISIMTVNSSNVSKNSRPKSPPMIVINGTVSKSPEKTKKVTPSSETPSSPSLRTRPSAKKVNKTPKNLVKNKEKENKPRNQIRDLRIIKKAPKQAEAKKKLRQAALQVVNKRVKNVRGAVKKVENKRKVQEKRRIEVVPIKKKQKPVKRGRPPLPRNENTKRGVKSGNKGRQRK